MATSRSFLEFSTRFTIIKKLVGVNTEKIVRKAAITGGSVAVLATPVRFGRARGNWIASLNSPARVTGKRSPDPSGARAISEGTRKIETWRTRDGSIFWINGVPYILRLENGSSSQAPSGMVALALQAAAKEFAKGGLLRGL